MSKLDDAAAKMAANLYEKTGKTLDEWIIIARGSGLSKHGEIMNLLKGEHGLTHGYANMISNLARRSDNEQPTDLVSAQYAGPKADLKPIYDAVVKQVNTFGDDIELSPKQAYVSLRRNKQFGLIQPSTKTRVDVGINLNDVEPTGRLEKSGSFNSMVSHRVRLTAVSDVDDQLVGWLKQAYDAA